MGGPGCETDGPECMFNNTLDEPEAGGPPCLTGMIVANNHEISENASCSRAGGCTASNEVVMTHAQAVAQGYMAPGTGTSTSNDNITCANDVAPCAPIASTDATTDGGANLKSYCTAMLGSSDGEEIVRAGMACQYGTTDSCTYDTASWSALCPRVAPVARPTDADWNVGAYQCLPTVDGGCATTGGPDAGV